MFEAVWRSWQPLFSLCAPCSYSIFLCAPGSSLLFLAAGAPAFDSPGELPAAFTAASPPLAPRSTSRGHDLLNNSTSVACMRNTSRQGYYIAKSEIKFQIPSAHFALVRSYNGLTLGSRGWFCSNMRMSGGMLQSQVGARGQENGAHTPPQELFSKYLFFAAHKGKQDKRIIY